MATQIKQRISGGKIQGDKLRAIRKFWFGGVCMFVDEFGKQCSVTHDLELAHAVNTELSKVKLSGRSSYERLNDVMNNPECFLLFCPKHHLWYDRKESIRWYKDYYEGDSREIDI